MRKQKIFSFYWYKKYKTKQNKFAWFLNFMHKSLHKCIKVYFVKASQESRSSLSVVFVASSVVLTALK